MSAAIERAQYGLTMRRSVEQRGESALRIRPLIVPDSARRLVLGPFVTCRTLAALTGLITLSVFIFVSFIALITALGPLTTLLPTLITALGPLTTLLPTLIAALRPLTALLPTLVDLLTGLLAGL